MEDSVAYKSSSKKGDVIENNYGCVSLDYFCKNAGNSETEIMEVLFDNYPTKIYLDLECTVQNYDTEAELEFNIKTKKLIRFIIQHINSEYDRKYEVEGNYIITKATRTKPNGDTKISKHAIVLP